MGKQVENEGGWVYVGDMTEKLTPEQEVKQAENFKEHFLSYPGFDIHWNEGSPIPVKTPRMKPREPGMLQIRKEDSKLFVRDSDRQGGKPTEGLVQFFGALTRSDDPEVQGYIEKIRHRATRR